MSVVGRPVEQYVLGEVSRLIDIAALDSRTLQTALERAWDRARRVGEHDETEQRRLALAQAGEKCRRRLTRAAALFVDGDLDKAAYEQLRADVQQELAAIDAELSRLGSPPVDATLPPLAEVLGAIGGWQAALRSADIPEKRELLGSLIEQLVPERTGHGRYRAKMHWTALGIPHCRLATEIRAANAA